MALDPLQEEREAGQEAIGYRPPQLPVVKVLPHSGRLLLCQLLAWDWGIGLLLFLFQL